MIPNQRQDRFAAYVAKLEARLCLVEATLGKAETTPQKTALFEEGAYAAVRAISADRIDQIAKIVADGISAENAIAEDQRRFLSLLTDLFDDDILALCH